MKLWMCKTGMHGLSIKHVTCIVVIFSSIQHFNHRNSITDKLDQLCCIHETYLGSSYFLRERLLCRNKRLHFERVRILAKVQKRRKTCNCDAVQLEAKSP